MVDVQFLVFIHIGSRRIWISPNTEHPEVQWTMQQARNFASHIAEEKLPCTILGRDNDKKYVASFDALFKSMDCEVKPITPMSPNLQAHVERVIQTIKHEVLNGFCIVSNSHLDYILRVTQNWYNHRRCHSARDNMPSARTLTSIEPIELSRHRLICDEELGGHLKSYRATA